MSIVVLLEPELVRASAMGDTTEFVERVRAVHAAPADPSAPGEPEDFTFCGLATGRMRRDPYRADRPGTTWYPPAWQGQVCPACDSVLHTS
ncbi:hypothetical protein OG535_01570 [Kitasatospora sp. NBC_00085]|uniref:hypothetical protein n=1 Tax=unclassified Kitasatospora TaxID=2633591 RepID=UPI002F9199B0